MLGYYFERVENIEGTKREVLGTSIFSTFQCVFKTCELIAVQEPSFDYVYPLIRHDNILAKGAIACKQPSL